MAAATVRVRGLRETQRALNQVNRRAARAVRERLKKAAEPVAVSARERLSRYQGSSVQTISPRASGGNVFVTQRKKRVTGLRPDFGSLTMREALIPALHEHEDELVQEVEEALDDLGRLAGF